MKNCLIGLLLLLAGCNSGGGGSTPPNYQPPISGWTSFFGVGVNIDSTGSFDIPAGPDSVQYIAEPHSATLGQTITMVFQISGAGTWGVVSGGGSPPILTLLLWERGDDLSGNGVYETYREYGTTNRINITNPGQYTLSIKLDPTLWTGVFGQTPSASAFQQLLNNLYAVGFVFGGACCAGHGVYSATGSFHFKLISYTIQ